MSGTSFADFKIVNKKKIESGREKYKKEVASMAFELTPLETIQRTVDIARRNGQIVGPILW